MENRPVVVASILRRNRNVVRQSCTHDLGHDRTLSSVPIDYSRFAQTLESVIREIHTLLHVMQQAQNRRIDHKVVSIIHARKTPIRRFISIWSWRQLMPNQKSIGILAPCRNGIRRMQASFNARKLSKNLRY